MSFVTERESDNYVAHHKDFYKNAAGRGAHERGQLVMHRPHGTISFSMFVESNWPANRRPDNVQSSRTSASVAKEQRHHTSRVVPEELRSDTFKIMGRREQENDKYRANHPPFRLGGRVGGAGAPGFKPARWNGKEGEPLWSNVVDEIGCAPEVRRRLHVKAQMPHVPCSVRAFHDHDR